MTFSALELLSPHLWNGGHEPQFSRSLRCAKIRLLTSQTLSFFDLKWEFGLPILPVTHVVIPETSTGCPVDAGTLDGSGTGLSLGSVGQ